MGRLSLLLSEDIPVSLTIKALLLLWPFLKRGLFGDLTIKEVVLANKHIAVVCICLGLVTAALFYTVVQLSVVKSELKVHCHELCTNACDNSTSDVLQVRRRLLGEILK